MKPAAQSLFARTCEVTFFVLLLVSEVAFIMGGWWLWLEYSSARA
jgi:hypothetical protein